jgi:hypothetical protein
MLEKRKIKAIRICLGFTDDCRIKLESSNKERTKQIRKTIYMFINEHKFELFPSCIFITDDREREQMILQATTQVMNGR